MHTTKRRALTLLEVMIAFSLTAILLSFLFSQFQKMSFASIETQKVQEIFFSRHLLQTRLAQVFAAVVTDDKEPSFYFDEKKLHFHFDQGVDPVPALCNEVTAFLYVNSDKNLVLDIFSLDGQTTRTEKLYENISSHLWEFVDKKDPEWALIWPKEKKDAPPIVRLTLNALTFAFFLPGANEPVTYKRGGGP